MYWRLLNPIQVTFSRCKMVHFFQAIRDSQITVIHRAIYALAFSAMFLGTYHEAIGQSRGIRSKITSITIGDEDDPLSNDEPYLILIRVRARLLGLATTSPRLDPASISVSLSMNGQNNLGRSSDNWADEPNSFGCLLLYPTQLRVSSHLAKVAGSFVDC